MSSRNGLYALCLGVLLASTAAQYSVPDVQIQALTNGGFRASIPDAEGIRIFGFHSKLNQPLNGKEGGSFEGDVRQSTNGRWVFESPQPTMRVGDVLNYWVFVQNGNLGFRKEGQSYTVTALVPPNTPWPGKPVMGTSLKPPSSTMRPNNCVPSDSTANGAQPPCKGTLMFSETFEAPLSPNKWVVEHRFPASDEEGQFVSYQKPNVKVEESKLKIKPEALARTSPFTEDSVYDGILDLRVGCTSSNREMCIRSSETTTVLPPVVSGRISTKNLFNFKYGRIEINAKLPQGDWLYPELYLVPQSSKYGDSTYRKALRVAFVPGNLVSNNQLTGGAMIDAFTCRQRGFSQPKASSPGNWGDAFHNYELIWTPESITLKVDSQTYATLKPPAGGYKSLSAQCPSLKDEAIRWEEGSKMAPFDQEMYIVLGVGVGGNCDFPDSPSKPWENLSNKAMFRFIENYPNWADSWEDESRQLVVDSVKVWAL